jgi:DNA invertase Pin-like site-specific DNA recombinase
MTEVLYNPKVKPEHLARKAIVYLRQSSERQVRQNKESQLLQYAVAERVRALGWKEVEIINSDLGSSAGLASAQREGFERVLSLVALGEVGIVGSREVSRLSRTDRDWCRLLEVCQIFGTLIADELQVYDLKYLVDQLVLGIKGTLSVVELKVIRQRLLAGQESKARRGELFKRLPIGMPETPWVRLCFIPTDGSVKRFNSCSPSFKNCGAGVRHSNGSVITTWNCRPTPFRERAWSGRFPRRA